MVSEEPWRLRVEGALSAHFFQPDGSSRPGTDWSVGLTQGGREFHVMVRSYLSEDVTRRARADTEYQARTVLEYLRDLLSQGWTPEQEGELVITIQNPTGEGETEPKKPWWRFW